MSEQTVNVPLLRKAVEWAEAEAAKPEHKRQWNQVDYAIRAEDIGRQTDCGTCYCLAGYVVSLGHDVAFDAAGDYQVDGSSDALISELAQAKLGLTLEQRVLLFLGTNTIEDVRRIAESIAGERL